MRFVIIGGNAAGMSAASKSKRNDPAIEVIVLEKTTDVSYLVSGLSYNMADAYREINDLIVRSVNVFRDKQKIDVRLGHTAERFDPKNRNVKGRISDGRDFEIAYDKLLIATGARARMLPIPGIDLPGVVTLRSLGDGRRLKQLMSCKFAKRALIVGAGYIGLEMADAFYRRDINVEMYDIEARLLPWMPPEMANIVQIEMENRGVKFHFGTKLLNIARSNHELHATFDSGTVRADILLIAVGILPNSEIATQAGLALGAGGAISVDSTMRTSDPHIYAAGDCADMIHVVTGQKVWIPLGLIANRGGWAVANNVTGRRTQVPGIVGTTVFETFDIEVTRTGLSPVEARMVGFDAVETRIRSRSRAHGYPGSHEIYVSLVADRASGRLLGGTIVGREGAAHRINALAAALHAKMGVREFVQCDMAYAPPFGPVWDPLLIAANQLQKEL